MLYPKQPLTPDVLDSRPWTVSKLSPSQGSYWTALMLRRMDSSKSGALSSSLHRPMAGLGLLYLLFQRGVSLGQSLHNMPLCRDLVPWVQPSGTSPISFSHLDHSFQHTDMIWYLLPQKYNPASELQPSPFTGPFLCTLLLLQPNFSKVHTCCLYCLFLPSNSTQ